jgi:hypothetical protein
MLIACFLRCESSPCFVLCYRILSVVLNDAFTNVLSVAYEVCL